jgi:transcriptional regulator with XRE-family HTH domain
VIVPRKPKFVHPLRALREAFKISQSEFGKMFGVSASLIQLIELGERNLNDDLADAIMLHFGIDAESLKRKHGAPVSVVHLDNFNFTFGPAKDAPTWPPSKEYRSIMQAVRACDRLTKIRSERERLRLSVLFWQTYVLPSWWMNHDRVRAALNNKLDLLFEAAKQKNRFHSVAARLHRWIDKTADKEFQLRKAINIIRTSKEGDAAKWPTFIETLEPDFWQEQPRRRKR